MTRREFTKPTKRLAYARSGGLCEAVGAVYGLDPGTRCNAPLTQGVEYDHYPHRAADGGDNSLENCAAVCPNCHRWKTSHFDTPMAAKGKRVSDKLIGITGSSARLAGRGFDKRPKQRTASRPINKPMEWIKNWRPQFAEDPGWYGTKARVDAALTSENRK